MARPLNRLVSSAEIQYYTITLPWAGPAAPLQRSKRVTLPAGAPGRSPRRVGEEV